MKKKKLTRNTFKFIISLETFLYGILGLVVSSLYFSKDYYDFINHPDNASLFWIGFVVLSAMIVSSALILIGLSIMFLVIVHWKNNKSVYEEN